jgi:hypothetical protein
MQSKIEGALYTLGMLYREIFRFDGLPDQVVDTTLRAPLTGLGMAMRTKAAEARRKSANIVDLMAKIPADLADPKGGVNAESQGTFWIGYYHWLAYVGMSGKLNAEHLKRAGKVLFGDRWQSDLARALDVNDRRIRAWATSEGKIPPMIWAQIAGLLRKNSKESADLLTEFLRLSKKEADKALEAEDDAEHNPAQPETKGESDDKV